MYRLICGGSIVLNLVAATALTDLTHQNVKPAPVAAIRAVHTLMELEKGDYLAAHRLIQFQESSEFDDLKDLYHRHIEDYTRGKKLNPGYIPHMGHDECRKQAVVHHFIETRRTCYAFLLRNGNYRDYVERKLASGSNFVRPMLRV